MPFFIAGNLVMRFVFGKADLFLIVFFCAKATRPKKYFLHREEKFFTKKHFAKSKARKPLLLLDRLKMQAKISQENDSFLCGQANRSRLKNIHQTKRVKFSRFQISKKAQEILFDINLRFLPECSCHQLRCKAIIILRR